MDKRQHSNIVLVQSLRGADGDIEHNLVDARQRLSVSKQVSQEFYMHKI
jgi:hypothetical protein